MGVIGKETHDKFDKLIHQMYNDVKTKFLLDILKDKKNILKKT